LGISQEMQELPGDLNPASYDPYEDEFIDLSDYDEEIQIKQGYAHQDLPGEAS